MGRWRTASWCNGRSRASRAPSRSASTGSPARSSTAPASMSSSMRSSGGAAVTGVEAISNGVTAFKKPEWRNARTTLVIMGSLLGVPLLRALLSVHQNPAGSLRGGRADRDRPDRGGSLRPWAPLGTAAGRHGADPDHGGQHKLRLFPRLASFHAGDNFMPKQLTKRGPGRCSPTASSSWPCPPRCCWS